MATRSKARGEMVKAWVVCHRKETAMESVGHDLAAIGVAALRKNGQKCANPDHVMRPVFITPTPPPRAKAKPTPRKGKRKGRG